MIIIAAIAIIGNAVEGGMGDGVIVVVVLIVVTVVVTTGTIFWKIPTMESFGTTKDTVHALTFTENGIIATQEPLTSSKGLINEELIPHGYGEVTLVETFAVVTTLTFSALMGV